NLRGHSGIISHNVTSSDPNSSYNGTDVQGVGANVADNDEPAVIITPARGTPMVVQDDPTFGTDSFTVTLSRPPLTGHTVTITAVPPQGLQVWDPATSTWTTKGVQLSFTGSTWYVAQTVQFRVDPNASSIPNVGDIQLSIAETIVVNGVTVAGLI